MAALSSPGRKKPVAHDEGPAIITDHAFEPRGAWFTLCKHCSLAEAAHAETTIDSRAHMHMAYYSDDDPDDE